MSSADSNCQSYLNSSVTQQSQEEGSGSGGGGSGSSMETR
jgi:hypothetical protein